MLQYSQNRKIAAEVFVKVVNNSSFELRIVDDYHKENGFHKQGMYR